MPTQIKEKPIIFNQEMVRAVLDGRKTQTRRVIKPQPESIDIIKRVSVPYNGTPELLLKNLKCPYGVPGDRLYVKETHYLFGEWVRNGTTKTGKQKWRFSRLSDGCRYVDNPPDKTLGGLNYGSGWYKRPSIFMERRDSRILLEITDIRAERV